MLTLTRRVGETLMAGDEITFTVLGVKGNQVSIGITAPKDVPVHREEVYLRIKQEQAELEQLFVFDITAESPTGELINEVIAAHNLNAATALFTQQHKHVGPIEHSTLWTPSMIIKQMTQGLAEHDQQLFNHLKDRIRHGDSSPFLISGFTAHTLESAA